MKEEGVSALEIDLSYLSELLRCLGCAESSLEVPILRL